MCDSCGCRDLTPIADLSADHEAIGELDLRVRAALRVGDVATARASFDAVVDVLRVHTVTEEHGVFAEARAEPDLVEFVDRLERDHADVRVTLDALHAAPSDDAWARGALAFLDTLADHIFVEEQDLFPASVVGLSAQAWARVVDAHAQETRATREQDAA